MVAFISAQMRIAVALPAAHAVNAGPATTTTDANFCTA
jgi:hypothetical protein